MLWRCWRGSIAMGLASWLIRGREPATTASVVAVDETQASLPDADRERRSLLGLAGWGFVLGSALFALGVPLSVLPGVPPTVAGWTYFVGSRNSRFLDSNSLWPNQRPQPHARGFPD